jgi:hypothetical protein
LRHELPLRGIRCERQKEVDVIYKGYIIKSQKLDILVEEEVALVSFGTSKGETGALPFCTAGNEAPPFAHSKLPLLSIVRYCG